MLHLTLNIIVLYLVFTNKFIRFLKSETHIYLSFTSDRLKLEDDALVNYKFVKNFKLFRYGN